MELSALRALPEISIDLIRPDGVDTGIKIQVRSKDHPEMQALQAAALDRRLAQLARNQKKVTHESVYDEAMTLLVAAVTGWSGITMGGKDWPCIPANAKALLTDNPWIKSRIDSAINDDALFFQN